MPHVEIQQEEIFGRYAEAIYTVTTTISLVGYGDYKGFIDNSGEWFFEMSLLILLILYGNYCFSSITQKVREYQTVLTPARLASQASQEMEHFLLNLQMKIKNRSLPESLIEFAKSHIYESVKSSTRYYFEDNHFYQDLPA